MEEAIRATEEGYARMAAGYIRVADADMRRQAILHQREGPETDVPGSTDGQAHGTDEAAREERSYQIKMHQWAPPHGRDPLQYERR